MEANNSTVDGSTEKEDRISALPDPVIQHILSFLLSTKQSIQTGILSKAWKNQWAHVPVLIFEKRFEKHRGLSNEDFIRFIDTTLLQYKCLKMKKFHISYDFEDDTNFYSKLKFAITKDVEVLCLDFWRYRCNPYKLPNFIFDNASLVELQIDYCDFELISSKVNWPSLKALKMVRCSLGSGLCIENVVSGSPLLESLEIKDSRDSKSFIHISSKSLKMLTLIGSRIDIEISCLNLEKLSIREMELEDRTIENVVCGSPSLHTLELQGYHFGQIVIVSKSLKKVFLSLFRDTEVEICCPNLEELFLHSCKIENCKLMNLPSSCRVTLDDDPPPLKDCPEGYRKILKQLQAFKDLTVGDWFVEILPASMTRNTSYPLLNVQCLTLNYPYFERIVGIVNVLRCSPALERLVIKFPVYKDAYVHNLHSKLKKFRKAYLNSNHVTGNFTCLESNLKTVKVIGLSKRYNKCKFILLFIEFLLKNAKALQKMEVIVADDLVEVSQKLLSFPRVSEHVIVELWTVVT